MSAAVRQLIETFDALPEPAKHEAVVEILRRVPAGDLLDETLTEAADELFRALDEQEVGHGAG